jgi:hypothetical protein
MGSLLLKSGFSEIRHFQLLSAHVAAHAQDNLQRHDCHRVRRKHVGRLLLAERNASDSPIKLASSRA